MSHGQHSHLFDSQASEYASFRPTYDASLFDRILQYDGTQERHTALDVATGESQLPRPSFRQASGPPDWGLDLPVTWAGSGQAAVELARKFER